ncbi:hypothetical protein PENTCL1PPCAC_9101, partial [Pristionchus entomophagus]
VTKMGDLRSTRGSHRLFDHSYYPDTATLRVRGEDFTISKSYLALHSPFFNTLFYGPTSTGPNSKFELDIDAHDFGDLLDLIYPCLKKTSCCTGCSSSMLDRLDLALKLELSLAVKRLLKEKTDPWIVPALVVEKLKEHNALHKYSSLLRRSEVTERQEVNQLDSQSPNP